MAHKVEIQGSSRDGYVVYVDATMNARFHWELLTGDSLAFISIPSGQAWIDQTRSTPERREEIARRIAAEVIARKAPGCHFEIGDEGITIKRACPDRTSVDRLDRA